MAAGSSGVLALGACDRAGRDMLRQPKLGPYAASPLFPDGKATRPPPPGTVLRAMGDAAAISSGRHGAEDLLQRDAAEARQTLPERPPPALLLRGQERYTIYCVPCHSPVGDGDGPVVRRGFPAPPSFHIDRLRSADDRHFFDVISQGCGVMYPYADRVAPGDRWAIVAYVRALQLSRHAPLALLPAALRSELGAAPGNAAGTGATAPARGEWRGEAPAPGAGR